MKRVCVIIPAYNEAQVIASVVKSAKKIFGKERGLNIDTVVVNDGSKDDTSAQAKKGGAIVINHILNSGAGGATLTGLAYARANSYDIAVTMDADGQHLPEDVLSGIKELQETQSDLLIGSRLINSKGMSKTKVIGNKGLSIITMSLFGVNVSDSQSGLRAYSRKAIDKIDWKSSGYEFCSEMIWRAKQTELKISEYPISAVYTEYSMSKGQNNWNAINIVKHLIKQRLLELFE